MWANALVSGSVWRSPSCSMAVPRFLQQSSKTLPFSNELSVIKLLNNWIISNSKRWHQCRNHYYMSSLRKALIKLIETNQRNKSCVNSYEPSNWNIILLKLTNRYKPELWQIFELWGQVRIQMIRKWFLVIGFFFVVVVQCPIIDSGYDGKNSGNPGDNWFLFIPERVTDTLEVSFVWSLMTFNMFSKVLLHQTNSSIKRLHKATERISLRLPEIQHESQKFVKWIQTAILL